MKGYLIAHPKIRLLLSWLLFFGLVAIAVFLISALLQGMGNGIKAFWGWIKAASQGTDAVIIVALITGAVSIVGVVVSSVVAKIIDFKQKKREYLYQHREEPYTEFVELVYKILDYTKQKKEYPQSEMLADIGKFSKKLTLWGSNRVIRKWIKFREMSNNKPSSHEVLFVIEDMLFAIRKDMGQRKGLMQKGDLLSFFINDIQTIRKPSRKA